MSEFWYGVLAGVASVGMASPLIVELGMWSSIAKSGGFGPPPPPPPMDPVRPRCSKCNARILLGKDSD